MSRAESPEAREYRIGIASAAGAFSLWGVVLPVYTKILKGVPAFEIVAHRILWGALMSGALALALRGWSTVRSSVPRRTFGALLVSAALVTVNWVVYILGIVHDQVVEVSLGYFLNPLVSVALGVVFLGERLRRVQLLACAIAAVGVVGPMAAAAGVPWIALALAFSFGGYGLVRKLVRIDALTGFFVEVAIVAPVAAAYLAWLAAKGTGVFSLDRPGLDLLLVGAGGLTALPLILFAAAARRLPLTTVGLLQFTSPSATLLLGVFVYGEHFSAANAVTFGCIWAALGLYVLDAIRVRMPRRPAVRPAAPER